MHQTKALGPVYATEHKQLPVPNYWFTQINLDNVSFISCTFLFSYKSNPKPCVGLSFKSLMPTGEAGNWSQFQEDDGPHKLQSPT